MSGLPSDLSAVKLALLGNRFRAETEGIEILRSEPIAIVGIGCRFPGGVDSPESFWDLLVRGGDAVVEMPPERAALGSLAGTVGGATVRGGFLDQRIDLFDPAFFGLSQAEAARMDPQQRLLLEVAWEALEDAGLLPGELAGSATGVFIGLSSQDLALLAGRDADRLRKIGPGLSHNMAANRLSYFLDLSGPSLEVDTACSSSLVAVHLACGQLRSRECDLALAGGVSLLLVPELASAYADLGLLAVDGRCKAFDATADGFGRGEGCGMVVLKRLSDALADRDPIRAVLRGSAVNQNGRSNGITAPQGLAQRQVFRRALENAGISPARLGYIEAHGTGTPLGDLIEVEALAEVLGESDGEPWCTLGSVKTNIAHLEAAAGIASLIKAALVLERGAIPPNLHCRTLHPEIARLRTPFVLPCELQPWPAERPRLAGVHSLGIGGTNAHAILEAAPSTPWQVPEEADAEPDASGAPVRLLTLSGHTAEVLRERVRSLRDFLERRGRRLPLADVCYTAAVRRSHHPLRLAALARTTAEMADVLSRALEEGGDLAGRVLGGAEGLPAETAELWARGGSVDWARFYPEGGRPLRLPVYLYAPSVCWWQDVPAPPVTASPPSLRLQATGSDLDSLELRPVPRRPPGPGEVEIRVLATALNFRDVLTVLGIQPGEAGPLGNECAGRIVAVGAGVEGLRPGDEVVAIAQGSFATLLTADARCVARKPESLSFEDAAVLPIVFLTATEALLDVARLAAGERVLIHAAAGGVGLAALQLARSAGAEIFATAGSAAKRELLASLGVLHVFDSRSTAFADRILEITGGEGVHVVLNSLAGDLLDRSLEILAPGGRFVEIGERNVLEPARVAALPPDVVYAHFDLLHEMKADPEAFGRRLRALLDRFAAGDLRPLPRRTFPLDQAAEAFRFMARAQHVGKIVLVQSDGEAPALIAAAPPRAVAAALPPALSETLRRAAGSERRSLLENSIRELVARLLGLAGPAEVDPRQPLGAQGLGSLESVELRNLLSSLVGRPLTAALVYNYPTVEALAELLSQEAGAPQARVLEGPARARVPAADEPIAVIGVGCRFPGGADGPAAFWELLCAGGDTVTEVPAERWDVDAYYDPDPHRLGRMSTRWGSFLAETARFDAPFFQIAPREAEAMDPQQRLLLEVTWEALENAGLHPDRLAGTASGVFVGMCSNSYWDLHMAHGGSERLDGDFVTGNIASVASGRLSYLLGLQGPSLTLDTACSSSLVAVHLACQSLRRGESDLALAGGVNLILSPELHILSSRLGVMARDGRCKTFDAAADGYSRGEGCGMVVLKRLSDALADGDPVLAVVRGTAVNQDGRSSALTAPNGRSQEAVLRGALADAGLPPLAIDYVETHGSATPLGDVIELGALGAVLGRERPADRPLLVGSVKTNFGHLEAAAGIAGFIKAALSVAHGRVPPHLHFRTPNPEVPFEELRLRVPGALEPWPEDGRPRRAGVSSFGLSGTNAHVVLEEPPPVPSAGEPRPWQLLPISAKTPSALEAATANLATFLRREPAVDLADVAYTLQVGRNTFSHRRFVLCRSASQAVDRIEAMDPAGVFTHAWQPGARPVVFLLGGVGDQYVEMGLGLYQTEPGFRRVIDRCAELLAPRLGLDLREVLYPRGPHTPELQEPAGESLDLRSLLRRAPAADDPLLERLSRTAVAQPALFTIEYALASLWMEWGIRPQAMIGHSLGEYVAACLAGVLSLEDALTLVAERARWIEELPGGAMLTVPLPEAEVIPLLGSELSLAAVNGPASCVVSGPAEAVGELERRLAGLGIPASRPRTSHAFHSRMLGSIASSLTELARSMPRQVPEIPYLSNVTGTWITPEQATDPGYWAQHMVQTVRFEAGVRELLSDPARILLEVGPGQALGSFVRQHPECAPDRVVLPSLRHASYREADLPFLLRSLGRLWLAGVEVDWTSFHVHERRRRVALPTYPFERQVYWIGGTEKGTRVAAVEDLARKADLERDPSSRPAHPRPALGTSYVAPGGDVQRRMAALWQELLGIEPVGIHDNFFELGGHSLLATQLLAKIRRTFRVDLPLRAIFEAPTISRLVLLIEEWQQAPQSEMEDPPIPRIERNREIPLSFSQERHWFLHHLESDSRLFNEIGVLELRGDLQVATFIQSVNDVVQRHEVLRTIFPATVDGRPVQVIREKSRIEIPVIDLGGLEENLIQDQLQEILRAEVHHSYDLEQGPLVRCSLARTGRQRHVAVVSAHHIVTDGASMVIFRRELAEHYTARVQHRLPVLGELAIQYADFACWQRRWLHGEVLEHHLAYWRRQLAGARPTIDLPLDRPRPRVPDFRGARQPVVIPKRLTDLLRNLSQEAGGTLFTTLTASFLALLHSYSGQDDITLGAPVANRGRVEIADLFGCFINALPLRVDMSGDPRFRELLARAKETVLGALAHEELPFEKLVEELNPERSRSQWPLFQIIFNFQNGLLEAPGLNGLDAELIHLESMLPAKYHLALYLREESGVLTGSLSYQTALFEPATIEQMAERFVSLLEQGAANPDLRLSKLSLLSETKRRRRDMENDHDELKKFLGMRRRGVEISPRPGS
jgi:acyl transferase domain-containing protein/D-arabinose 1-dehydrogenase-like Zn-dependent alcohol dehydrogenase